MTPGRLALTGTKQVRPDANGPFGSVAVYFDFCRQGRRRDRLQRDRNLGDDNPANVQSDAKSRKVFVRLCQARAFRYAVGFSEFGKVLMIAERTMSGLVHPQRIEEMERELTKVIEDFDCAMNVETLRLAKGTSKHSLISLFWLCILSSFA